ncbi:DNA-binding response regulator [Lacrimispora amygdalina]|uniref:Stage 0 sporulation protein A homolog n=1 Tax=Lacrimispora amygdalina TaxID=253257 RepID=A0A3E2NI13_9FIRM|nr:response regulator transcription factor [Clostridium indicum]RFZ80561.1 DNA-binding response regulator [Clostridium indicum]
MINVLIVDDQKLLRESFKHIIENNSDIKVVGCVTNGKEAFNFCNTFIPNVILMDLSMPVCNGTEATKLIKSKYTKVKILILSSSSDGSDVVDAIKNGADGYIGKNIGAEELILSIKSTAAGLATIDREVLNFISLETSDNQNDNKKQDDKQKSTVIKINDIDISLTKKELSIISMIVDGKDNKQIGTALFMAEGTAKNKITEIINKLQLKDRTQLAVFALKNNLI